MLFNQEVLLLVLAIIFIWLGIITTLLLKSLKHYEKLGKGLKEADLGTILEKIINQQNLGKKQIEQIFGTIEKIEKKNRLHIQKMGLVRFNPFSETGGDQSFALALLDEENNGLIISSLHSRDNTRIYAKPIEKGKPVGYDFSKEEKQAIDKAENGKN
jgi:hypothetical protein